MARKSKQHWCELYLSIGPRISSYEGSLSIYEVIRQEGQAVGYSEKILDRILKAGAFLAETMAMKELSKDSVKCGYTHIELLMRLYKLDTSLAIQCMDKVLENKITLSEMNEQIANSRKKDGQAFSSARAIARQRVNEHRRLSIKLIDEAGPGFFGKTDAEMVLVSSFRSLGQFVLLNDQQGTVAVITRVGDSSLKPAKAAEILLDLALANKVYFEQMWMILPNDSNLIQELIEQASDMNIFEKWLFLATPSADETTLVQRHNEAKLLSNEIFFKNNHRWEGVSMIDGRKLNGVLMPS